MHLLCVCTLCKTLAKDLHIEACTVILDGLTTLIPSYDPGLFVGISKIIIMEKG